MDDNSFSDLYSDVMDMCMQCGKVMEIKIPRPIWKKPEEDQKMGEDE
eukprot:CAMPEP_0170543828 /NCGR_PEP_ID=MMETSP0211-20121228/2810_1 /TAXON_ID=311385 /ORGANISM="Pseudokeronopsis sp., Strain OXSARD2" /LENGTH=46 /DNA_ID= /DNA_START= /DNA_END= /DNA_ORIENTATION=